MADYDVAFVDRGDRRARFVVRPITPAFANGIRRAMLADVPTFSIDTVRVIENSSVMFDEQIGLRLGLVPLTTPPGEFEIGDTVTLALDVTGPETLLRRSRLERGTRRAADEAIPIIELKEDQRLEVEADAVLDRGSEHAKHQGGVAVGYRHLQRVEVVGDRSEFADDESQILRGVIEEQAAEHAAGDATDGELVPTDQFDNDLAERYPGKELAVSDVSEAFVFDVETDGSLSIDELVLGAVETIETRAADLKQQVQL
jgi:DNA-directed RNA polymerase, subunit D (EC 2.7.7.6)